MTDEARIEVYSAIRSVMGRRKGNERMEFTREMVGWVGDDPVRLAVVRLMVKHQTGADDRKRLTALRDELYAEIRELGSQLSAESQKRDGKKAGKPGTAPGPR